MVYFLLAEHEIKIFEPVDMHKEMNFIAIFIHIHISGLLIIILQIICLVDYLNLFVKPHYMMSIHLNMNFLLQLLNHFHFPGEI